MFVVDRKENKQGKFAESEIKHFVRGHKKNDENAMFRTNDEGTLILGEMLGITAGVRGKKGSPVCSGWTTSKV